MNRRSTLFLVSGLVLAVACATADGQNSGPDGGISPGSDAGVEGGQSAAPIYLAPEPQRPGDPQKGYSALVNNPYVPCGIPKTAYAKVFGPAGEADRIPGREGKNVDLPYNFTSFTTKENVEVITSNCLTCHAGRINGKLVVGLGAADGDFTATPGSQKNVFTAVGQFVETEAERAEWLKWKERVTSIVEYSHLETRGPNPADEFTGILFAHHDPKTLAWISSPPNLPQPSDVPVDVPPWWRMAKKSSMFYVGGGRGDHARHMMTASILCISSVEEAKAIDAYFGDVNAYISTLAAPKYPFPIDEALAAKGRTVFEATCSRCHGTYGDKPTYPNLLVPLADVRTDALLASGTAQFTKPLVDWHAASFFGEISRLEPLEGYVPPPLDGIWATAPFLHNGSVPTIAALLDSKTRPTYWSRSFDSNDFDPVALGWKHTVLSEGKEGAASAKDKAAIYDTTHPGYGNGGHTYGDALTPSDRAAVIEYLKKL
ncbi:MAG: hypothetical protein U0174_23015 [Polyangiaceae bacterium]